MQIPLDFPDLLIVLEACEYLPYLNLKRIPWHACDFVDHALHFDDLGLAARHHASEDAFRVEVQILDLSIGLDPPKRIEEQW